MKKILGVTLVLTFLALAAPARAESVDYVVYNSTTAAADAAISTGVLNTLGAESLTIHLRNAGSQARTAAIECYDPSGVQTVSRHTVAVGATSDAHVYIDPRASSVTAATGYTIWPMKPCHKTAISAAAATGSMRTVVLKRVSK